MHSRIDPVVDPQLPREQAGFRRGRSTVGQVTLLTQDIEDSFQHNQKAGVVFLDLTAAYDTVWHRGLHLKLLRIVPDRHMVGFIMEMLSNRSFVVHTSDGQRSRLRIMKNGVPQGSVLSPMMFNIYISDLPETTSRKYGYADDLTILLRRPSWKEMEEGLDKDMTILVDYLQKRRLQLSIGRQFRLPTISITEKLNGNWTCLSITNAWCFSKLQSTLACAWTGCCTSSNTLKKWQEKLHPESHSSVILLVQPGEPLPKHCGSPLKPWYSLQLNTVPLSGAEAHT